MILNTPNLFTALVASGGIEDLGLGLRWDATELGNEVLRRAGVLSQMGIGRGSVVTVTHGGSARFFADLFAIWHVGATAACVDPSLTPRELRTVVDFAKSVAVLIDGAASADHLPVPIVDLGSERPKEAFGVSQPLHPDDPAIVLFTSGTTGVPKGVVLSFRALLERVNANIATIGTAALARALVSLPTHFGHGLIGNSLTPLLSGGRLVLHPTGIPMANDLGRIVDRHKITFMSSVPTFWTTAVARSPQPAGDSLVRIHIGSAPLRPTLWSQVAAWSRAEVVNCYGTTETANWIGGASSRTDGIAEGLVGKMWGGSAALIDEGGSIQPNGKDGEILVRSPSMMSGYLDRPDLTAAAFCQGWYRTGDRGSIDEQGRIWLTGRIKDEINRAGFKVQPAEIDALLESNPAVAEACVFGISDPLGGEAVAAAIRPKGGASTTPQDLQAWCLERARRDAVPERWFIVSEIPRNARGKVSRDAVRRTLLNETVTDDRKSDLTGAAADKAQTPAVAAQTVAEAVEQAWVKVLGRDAYLDNAPLLESGGDSLDALRIWLLIEKIIGRQFSMDALEDNPTPRRLTAALEQQSDYGNVSSARVPLVFLMPPAGGDSPVLARFRAAFKGNIRFAVIEYPGWRQMTEAGAGIGLLADAAVAQIRAQSKDGDVCLLAGYSFGGLVAVEAARRLAELGHRIGFLGVIDTTATNTPTPSPSTKWHRIVTALILMSAFRMLRIIGQSSKMLPSKQAFTLEFILGERLRAMSVRGWKFGPAPVPITLYRSDDGAPADKGWGATGSRVKVVQIGGSHQSMLEPPFIDVLCERFVEAVDNAFEGAGSRPQV